MKPSNTPPASMSALDRLPACSNVRRSVHATCTYFQAPSTQAGVSSTPITAAARSNTRTRSTNGPNRSTASRTAARTVPGATRNPHNTSNACTTRPNGRYCAPRRYTILAFAPGPNCTRPDTPAGASPHVTTPHPGHSNDST